MLEIEKRLAAIDRLAKRLKAHYTKLERAFGLYTRYTPKKLISSVCEDCMNVVLVKRCNRCAGLNKQKDAVSTIFKTVSTIFKTKLQPLPHTTRSPVEIFDATRVCEHCWKLRCRPCAQAPVKKAIVCKAFDARFSPLHTFINTTLANFRSKLHENLKTTEQAVNDRIIATSRAVLCTVDTAGQLLDKSYDACTERLKMACLDEAGIRIVY